MSFSIHAQIRLHRQRLGLSQKDLAEAVSKAERLAKPISYQTVQKWEQGGSAPKRKRLAVVAKILQTTASDLLGTTTQLSDDTQSHTALPSLDMALAVIASALDATSQDQREVVATLLNGLAKQPSNRNFVRSILYVLQPAA